MLSKYKFQSRSGRGGFITHLPSAGCVPSGHQNIDYESFWNVISYISSLVRINNYVYSVSKNVPMAILLEWTQNELARIVTKTKDLALVER